VDTISTLVQAWVLSSIARRCATILSLSQGVRVQQLLTGRRRVRAICCPDSSFENILRVAWV
jgi:hypothetical protein